MKVKNRTAGSVMITAPGKSIIIPSGEERDISKWLSPFEIKKSNIEKLKSLKILEEI